MIIYSGTKSTFVKDVASERIADIISIKFSEHGIAHDNEREYLAWQNSLRYMRTVMDSPCFDDGVTVSVEYCIPNTSKRVDFIVAGKDDVGKEHVVVVELKQWTKAQRTRREDIVKAFTGGAERDVPHPSYQAYSYAKTIENFSAVVQDEDIVLKACAFLHNYVPEKRAELDNDFYGEVVRLAPIFIKDEEEQLRDFISKYVSKPGRDKMMYVIDHGRIRPSKALQDVIGSMIDGNEEFCLIDEQKTAFESVRGLVHLAMHDNKKHTVIITGGPGTGKSVVAINLLVALLREGFNIEYVTKNATPRNVYFEMLKRQNHLHGYVKNLFKSSGSFVNAKPGVFDCLLVDEAHRLNARSFAGFGFHGENQIKEIINASKVSVFFVDDDQIVTGSDIGSVAEIKRWANLLGSEVYQEQDINLVSQFRCNGSDGYMAFIDDLLQRRHTANYDGFDGQYDFRVFDDPVAMREELRKLNEVNNKSRMIAGYCYEWDSKKNPKAMDIVLENGFAAQWNFSSTSTWAIDKKSFDQVGCIHTSQGLEFDYVGIIIGNDLLFRNGKVITDANARAKTDASLRGTGTSGVDAMARRDMIIRNTYKVLLTRGQKGCFVYCQDKELGRYLKTRLDKMHKC